MFRRVFRAKKRDLARINTSESKEFPVALQQSTAGLILSLPTGKAKRKKPRHAGASLRQAGISERHGSIQ
jgi:hypothetical protein